MENIRKNSVFGIRKAILTLVLAVITLNTFGSQAKHHTESHTSHGETEEKFDAVKMIMHHISDAHEFHIAGDIHIALPIILYSKDKGLNIFSSSAFHGGATVHGYKMGHHGIEDEHGHHSPGLIELFSGHIGFYDFSITKNVFSLMLSAVILLLIFTSVASKYKKQGLNSAPKGFQNLIETLIVFVRDEIAKPNISDSKVSKFLPYLLTIFFFVWINNLIGLIPFFPFSANLTGNIAFTLTLAVCTMVVTNLNGNKDYWGHIFWMPGVPAPMKIVLAPIELIGVFTKPFALMVRLFANITAGHIIILSLISIIFIMGASWAALSGPLTLFMNVLELLVAFLQAYVFTLLSALFIGQATEEHHH